jgi:hypothetical protein
MSGVFQNIDPPPPPPPSHSPFVRGVDTLAGWNAGLGVNILEDARHSSVLYICKYFAPLPIKELSMIFPVHFFNVQDHRLKCLAHSTRKKSWERSRINVERHSHKEPTHT